MARSDFIYEHQVNRCPIIEEQAEKVLRWLHINPKDAFEYMGVSTCRAVLIGMSSGLRDSLYPPEYISPCQDTGR